jgi:hypothetical protein
MTILVYVAVFVCSAELAHHRRTELGPLSASDWHFFMIVALVEEMQRKVTFTDSLLTHLLHSRATRPPIGNVFQQGNTKIWFEVTPDSFSENERASQIVQPWKT